MMKMLGITTKPKHLDVESKAAKLHKDIDAVDLKNLLEARISRLENRVNAHIKELHIEVRDLYIYL